MGARLVPGFGARVNLRAWGSRTDCEVHSTARRVPDGALMPSPTQQRGSRQEDAARRVLTERGYCVVEQNWRRGRFELDLVAWDGDVLVFVEVRARASRSAGRAEETIGARKQRHVARAALAYLAERGPGATPAVRFDVVGVDFDARTGETRAVTLVRGAFDAGVLASGRSAPWL
jgi:putative endonuclease